MSEFVAGLTKALEDQAKGLRRLRHVDEYAAWEAIRETSRGNLADSVRTDGEVYWKACIEVAERHLVDSSDRRWTS